MSQCGRHTIVCMPVARCTFPHAQGCHPLNSEDRYTTGKEHCHITQRGRSGGVAADLSNNSSDEVICVLLRLAGLDCHLAVQARPCIRVRRSVKHIACAVQINMLTHYADFAGKVIKVQEVYTNRTRDQK